MIGFIIYAAMIPFFFTLSVTFCLVFLSSRYLPYLMFPIYAMPRFKFIREDVSGFQVYDVRPRAMAGREIPDWQVDRKDKAKMFFQSGTFPTFKC